MRRTSFAAVVVAALACLGSVGSTAHAQQLGLGDAVPSKIDIEKFFQGDELTRFSKEKTYVLEFWATW